MEADILRIPVFKRSEKKYSSNELEMLAVVWGAEYFVNCVGEKVFNRYGPQSPGVVAK